jgi:hypothetical protein
MNETATIPTAITAVLLGETVVTNDRVLNHVLTQAGGLLVVKTWPRSINLRRFTRF